MAGAVYTIQMDSSEFDPFLRLEDSTGQQVAFNDDSGDGLNARIDYTPPETGLYRVICTSFIKGATGQFRLLVSEKD
jgi:serralysin